MKPICFIGARGGSKGVPKKNLRKLGGKPLIVHTIKKALKSGIFSHVIVSTEDKKIAAVSRKHGAEVPFRRPKKLATDTATMEDVLVHGLKKLFSLGYNFDIFVLLDATAPFIRVKDIQSSINLLRKKKCDAVFGVYHQHFNPYFNMMELNSKGFLKMVKTKGGRPGSRQQAPKVYQFFGLYTFDARKFLKRGKVIMPKILPYEVPMETGIMIDTKLEFKIVKLIMENNLIDWKS